MAIFKKIKPRTCTEDKAPADRRIDWPGRLADLAEGCTDPRLQAYYRCPSIPADTPISKLPMLAMDIETTGLDDQRDAIVSIGHIAFDATAIYCNLARNWIVQPSRPVENNTVTIHGITHSQLRSAPPLADRFEALLGAMAGRVVVAHCHAIERQFLYQASLDLTGETLDFPIIDTMAIEAQKHPYHRPNPIQRWLGDRPSPSLRLDATRSRYGLPAYRPHHALTDALATAELLLAQLQNRFEPHTPVARLWV